MTADLPLPLRVAVAVERAALPRILSRPWITALLAGRNAAPCGGRRLDAQAAALVTLSNIDPSVDTTDHTPAEARVSFVAQIAAVDALTPSGLEVEDHEATGPGGPIPLRLYTPPGAVAPSPAVVYLHGGGWVVGDLSTHDCFCRRLALGTGCRVIAVDYRLAPEHPFPAAALDAVAAFRWIAQHAGELGIDAARLAVAGDSAGGNLSAVVANQTRGDARRPALQVLLYASVDATCSEPSHDEMGEGYFLTSRSIAWYLGHYVGSGDRRHPDVSPLFAADVSSAPPALIYTAGFDPLRDEGLRYAEKLRAAGVPARHWEFPSLVHGFVQMTGTLDAARAATEEIFTDVRRALGR